MRWYPQASWTAGMSAAQVAAWNSGTWFQLAIAPVALNLVWVVLYYLTVSSCAAFRVLGVSTVSERGRSVGFQLRPACAPLRPDPLNTLRGRTAPLHAITAPLPTLLLLLPSPRC